MHLQPQHIAELQQHVALALAEAAHATSTITWADPAVPPSLVIPPPVTAALEHPAARLAQEDVMEMELDPVLGQAPVAGDILLTADGQEVVVPEGMEVIITQSASGTKYAKLVDKPQAPVEPQASAPSTIAEELVNVLHKEQSVAPIAEKEADMVETATDNTVTTEESSDESKAAKIQ